MTEQQRNVWRQRTRRQREKLFAQRVMVDGRWFHPDASHGEVGGYTRFGCRCGLCTEAQRIDIASRKADRHAERVLIDGRLVHPRAKHGTENAYGNYGCRCVPCSDVWSRAMTARNKRRLARTVGAA